MRKINLSKRTQDFLKSCPPKQGKQLSQKILSLALNPVPHDAKKLKGSDYVRTDSGEYRIVYEFDELEVRIVLIGKRNDDDVYKRVLRI